MDFNKIEGIRNKYWRPDFGTLNSHEMHFISKLILEHNPKRFLEVGVASGLTAAIILESLKASDATNPQYAGVDLDLTFWADRTKPTGYVIEDFKDESVSVELLLGKTMAYFHNHPTEKFDMVFIDANHRHPWPTLDTIMALPLLNKNGIIIHHDLECYSFNGIGIGPKILFDQVDPQQKVVCQESTNIGYLKCDQNIENYTQPLANSLYLPWNVPARVPYRIILLITEIIKKHFGSALLESMYSSVQRFY